MQFTPQQLSGGPKYSSTTRIGNWQEEVSLEESKLTDFRKRSNKGNLAIRMLETKMSACTQKAALTYSDDGLIRFGDVIMLSHDGSGHLLACDPFEDFLPGAYKYYTSCTGTMTPVARNTFRVVRAPAHLQSIDADMNDDVLRVGQAFCLMCNESLLVKPDSRLLSPPLYLSSTKKNEREATKTTNRQLVFMSPANDADSVWVLCKPSQGRANASERYLSNGEPVNATDTFLVCHRQTNCCLVCDKEQRDHTDFGVELECYADRTNAFGKLGLIVSEFKGLSTSYTLAKPDAPHYFWHIVTAASQGIDATSADALRASASQGSTSAAALGCIPSNADLVAEFKTIIRSRGIDAYWNLRQFFFSGDSEFDGKIDRGDLKDGLMCWGINMDHRYIDRVIDQVDSKRTNSIIDFPQFMQLIRSPMSQFRASVVNAVWTELDPAGTGGVTISDLKARFDSSNHPLVTIAHASHDTVMKQLLLLCRTRGSLKTVNVNIKTKEPVVVKQAFINYYADLSAGLSDTSVGEDDSDTYFEKVVTSNWRV